MDLYFVVIDGEFDLVVIFEVDCNLGGSGWGWV